MDSSPVAPPRFAGARGIVLRERADVYRMLPNQVIAVRVLQRTPGGDESLGARVHLENGKLLAVTHGEVDMNLKPFGGVPVNQTVGLIGVEGGAYIRGSSREVRS